jgi:drug/metabolite transporter (DMT)-like permease
VSLLERLSPSEVVGLLLALGGAAFVLVERRRLRRNGDAGLPAAAFAVLLAGWVLTLAEEFAWPGALNLLEHLCYATGTALLAGWCWRRLRRRGGDG